MSKALVCPCGDVTVEDIHHAEDRGCAAEAPRIAACSQRPSQAGWARTGQAKAEWLRTREAA
ncbi:MAG: hypothetical protein FJ086_18585 [Deltaproteobacteria bacterium]|nr:hypothetical protein [Deltaproteobacteria bacterium]